MIILYWIFEKAERKSFKVLTTRKITATIYDYQITQIVLVIISVIYTNNKALYFIPETKIMLDVKRKHRKENRQTN